MTSLVLNLCSQNGIAKRKWKEIEGRFDAYSVFKIEKPEDWMNLPAWLNEETKKGIESLIVAGGDGTVHALIQLIQQIKAPLTLGMIGLGSSNDYHKPNDRSGIEWLGKTPARTQFQNAKNFDLLHFTLTHQGKVTEQWSALNASIGITASGNAIFNDSDSFASRLKSTSVDLAISAAALQAYFKSKPLELSISLDASPSETHSIVSLGIFKKRYFAGSFHYDQEPAFDDGHFGLAVTNACSRIAQLKILMGLAKGNFSGLPHCKLSFHQKMKIESKTPFVLEIDGETQTVDTVQVSVLRNAIRLCP